MPGFSPGRHEACGALAWRFQRGGRAAAGPRGRRVKGGLRGSGGVAGVRDWRLLFPGSCHVRGERPGGSRTGRSPAAAGGAGGVLEVTGREPDDLAAGNGSRGPCWGVRLFSRSVPWSSGAGSAAGCIHPFACPRPGAGGHGAGPRQRGGQAGSITFGARAAG